MIARLRLLLVLARPAVVLLLLMYAAIGVAVAGRIQALGTVAWPLVAVVAFLLACVAVNDLADEVVDRINLPNDPRRPLVAGTAVRRDLVVVAVVASVVALGAAAAVGWPALFVLAVGLLVGVGYSLPPMRLAARGAVAALVLPACYVAVPYLLGVFAGRHVLRAGDLGLLGGLYVGFIGRIVLKDFRDVVGDALFGKRTFLVRHGRRATCLLSAACWVAGCALVLAAAPNRTLALTLLLAILTAAAVALLTALARAPGARRDEALIAAIAIIGRGLLLLLLAHLSMLTAQWSASAYNVTLAALFITTTGQAWTMARHGPTSLLTVRRALGVSVDAPALSTPARAAGS